MIEFAFSHTIRGAGRSFSLNVEAKSDSGLLLLTGPSGSGKTTTLQCLAGIQKVDRGHLFLKGKYWFSTGRNRSICDGSSNVGYVPQSAALFPHLNVEKNIAFPLRSTLRGLLTPLQASEKEIIERLMERLEIQELRRSRPAHLSGGQRQRVALARALVLGPELILLDEPLSSLNRSLALRSRDLFLETCSQTGAAMVVVAHDANLWSPFLSMGARHIVIEDGKSRNPGPGE